MCGLRWGLEVGLDVGFKTGGFLVFGFGISRVQSLVTFWLGVW